MRKSEKTQKRNISIKDQVTAAFLSGLLLLFAVVPSFSSATTNTSAPEGMVYCPLSHKFQPGHSPEKKQAVNPFNKICVSQEKKDVLFQKIVRYSFKKISPEENDLTDLAFDFFEHGESVFSELPDLPDLPSGNLIKRFGSGAVVNNNFKHQFVFQDIIRYFSTPLLARPPTASSLIFSAIHLIHQSDELSRRLAPRAPPVRS